ncbi:MAG: hypothetical protein HY362_04370 [Candidatus Aenigmarchaeota archaeon]|nr:hypothetical protein [Candidatus Aenigmarchaeota archaeon]
MGTQITIRDVDTKTFREFKAASVSRGLKLGTAVTLAMEKFKSEIEGKEKFAALKPIKWGKGTERVSEDVDKILYGE